MLIHAAPIPPALDEAALVSVISANEAQRADRFRHDGARLLFLAGRYLLRTELGRRLDLPARSVPIVLDDWGKPRAAMAGAPSFNISHTEDLVAIGFADEQAIGIDVERLDRAVDIAALSAQAFSKEERGWLERQPDRRGAFLTIWTLKEALLKADGRGFGMDPRSVTLKKSDAGWSVAAAPSLRLGHVVMQLIPIQSNTICAVVTEAPGNVEIVEPALPTVGKPANAL